MKKYKNVDLSKKTTLKIGGIAENFFVPENEEELLDLINNIKNEKFYILSGGSNLLINDKKVFKNIISMELIEKGIEKVDENDFFVGASNRIQEVINTINKYGYGGIEELYSLPAMFGGIIYMNAGVGSEKNKLFSISDFINKVKVLNINKNQIEWLEKEECKFEHRSSLFHNNNYIILGALCSFYEQNIEISKKRINDRIEKCKKEQEWGKGCFGTCFSKADRKLLKLISILSINKKGIYQSSKNSNWLVNDGNGTFKKAIKIINKAEKLHRIFHKNIKCEIIIWR